jgi:hypothetical protein
LNPQSDPAPAELHGSYIVWSYIAIVIAAAVAAFMAIEIEAPTIVVATGFTSFAVIYIVAQAIERFLQPISEIWGKPEQVEEAKQTVAAKKSLVELAAQGDATQKAEKEEAVAQKELDYRKLERATFFWAIASVLALLVCGALGLGLLQSVSQVDGGNVKPWFQAFDVIVTGLAIGAGTKPLHDLISAIQKAKEKE